MQGVFQLAYKLWKDDLTSTSDQETLCGILVWFEENLTFSDKSTIHPSAIFWYKSCSHALTQKTWELVSVLKKYGANIEFVRTGKPGYVTYEDDYQIAAIPFRDTFSP